MGKPHGIRRVTGRRTGLITAILGASLVFPSAAIALSGGPRTAPATSPRDAAAVATARRAHGLLELADAARATQGRVAVAGATDGRPAAVTLAAPRGTAAPTPASPPKRTPAPAAKPQPSPLTLPAATTPTPKPTPKASPAPKASPSPKPSPKPKASPKPTPRSVAPAKAAPKPVAKPAPSATPKPRASTPAPKPTPRPAAPSFAGRNAFWYPDLRIDEPVYAFPCERARPPDAPVYRWGCAGPGNVYLLAHAATKFRALNEAYYGKRLKVGQLAVYADSNGKVHYYRLDWWKVAPPTTGASWAWAAQSRSSLTLQTCVGPNDSLRLFVRFHEVAKP